MNSPPRRVEPAICGYSGGSIEEPGQPCPALAEGACEP